MVWWEEERGSVTGRAEVFNIQGGIASSFSCGGGCSCGPWWYNDWMSPSSFQGLYGDQGQPFAPLAQTTDCSHSIYGPFNYTSSSTWSSSNTSVATVSSTAWVSCLVGGSANITAQFQLNDAPDFIVDFCPVAAFAPLGALLVRQPKWVALISDSTAGNPFCTSRPAFRQYHPAAWDSHDGRLLQPSRASQPVARPAQHRIFGASEHCVA